MAPAFLELTGLDSDSPAGSFPYRFAGESIRSTVAIAEFSRFADPLRGSVSVDEEPPHLKTGLPATLTFRGEAWLANSQRRIECWTFDAGFDIRIAGIGGFTVDFQTGRIDFDPGEEAIDPGEEATDLSEVVEALLGPPLILALAARGIHCLHAGAVMYRGRALAFVGASGRGKSTLAQSLSGQPGSPFRLLADDILPLRIHESHVDALPRYPQLKYPPGRQPSLAAPESLPLAAVYVLRNGGAGPAQVQPLAPSAAILEIVRNTVASKLFDHNLMRTHFLAATNVAEHTPIRILHYPHTQSSLHQAYEALLQDVESLA